MAKRIDRFRSGRNFLEYDDRERVKVRMMLNVTLGMRNDYFDLSEELGKPTNKVMIDALSRGLPMTVGKDNKCPNCGEENVRGFYCSVCGQRLNRGEKRGLKW